jgi:hypothetical protein
MCIYIYMYIYILTLLLLFYLFQISLLLPCACSGGGGWSTGLHRQELYIHPSYELFVFSMILIMKHHYRNL